MVVDSHISGNLVLCFTNSISKHTQNTHIIWFFSTGFFFFELLIPSLGVFVLFFVFLLMLLRLPLYYFVCYSVEAAYCTHLCVRTCCRCKIPKIFAILHFTSLCSIRMHSVRIACLFVAAITTSNREIDIDIYDRLICLDTLPVVVIFSRLLFFLSSVQPSLQLYYTHKYTNH